ncbi:ankyrin [Nemania serpens]|nr:ankyrin [Nemania serpens]
MPFSSFPPEVVHAILVPALRVRDKKRALRLRLVSRAWNVAVEGALFESGIFYFTVPRNCDESQLGLWKRCFAGGALRYPPPQNQMRGQSVDESQARIMVAECAEKICLGTAIFDGQLHRGWYPGHRYRANRFDGDFQLALLAATACTGDLDVARRILLPRHPYAAAAYRGDTEFISYLLANEAEISNQRESSRATIIDYAAGGNHLSLVNLALGPSFDTRSPDFEGLRDSLESALWRTTSVDIFKRCFELVKDHLRYPHVRDPSWWFPAHRRGTAARQGATALMKHLYTLHGARNYVDGYDRDFDSPISKAAFAGHGDIVKWLLERRAEKDHALKAAVIHGSYSITQLLLEHGDIRDDKVVQEALIEAVREENETLFRLLLAYGANPDAYTLSEVMRMIEAQKLESMGKLLQEYWDEEVPKILML